jgi:hypothetical protein
MFTPVEVIEAIPKSTWRREVEGEDVLAPHDPAGVGSGVQVTHLILLAHANICCIGRAPGRAGSSHETGLFVRSVDGHLTRRRPPYHPRCIESTALTALASHGIWPVWSLAEHFYYYQEGISIARVVGVAAA